VRISAKLRRFLLACLFAASVTISAIGLGCWWPSYSSSIAIEWSGLEVRLHKGCLCFTSRGGGKTSVRFTCEPISAADPWPEFYVSRDAHAAWTLGLPIPFHPDPDEVSLLGFNVISHPAFDLAAVPIWAIITTMGIYQAWWLLRGRTLVRRYPLGCCIACGYNLKGLIGSQRCPECGQRFNWGWARPAPAATDRARRHQPAT
jgi:hypothetical protein